MHDKTHPVYVWLTGPDEEPAGAPHTWDYIVNRTAYNRIAKVDFSHWLSLLVEYDDQK